MKETQTNDGDLPTWALIIMLIFIYSSIYLTYWSEQVQSAISVRPIKASVEKKFERNGYHYCKLRYSIDGQMVEVWTRMAYPEDSVVVFVREGFSHISYFIEPKNHVEKNN